MVDDCPLLSHPISLLGLVSIPAFVPRNLPGDRTPRANQAMVNLALPEPCLTPRTDQPTLRNGHRFVGDAKGQTIYA